jgi:hypothetical protein
VWRWQQPVIVIHDRHSHALFQSAGTFGFFRGGPCQRQSRQVGAVVDERHGKSTGRRGILAAGLLGSATLHVTGGGSAPGSPGLPAWNGINATAMATGLGEKSAEWHEGL